MVSLFRERNGVWRAFFFFFPSPHRPLFFPSCLFLFTGAFKYLPYGSVRETTAYLVRRARENAGALGGVGSDVRSVEKELARRFASALFVPTRVAERTGGAWK